MTTRPYTDDQLRAHTAWLIKTHGDDLETLSINETAEDHGVDTTGWDSDTWDAYIDDVWKLIRSVPDLTDWRVSLGVAGLTEFIDMGWYVTGSGWDLAVQIAHRPEIRDDVLDEIESAVRLTVERVLKGHGLVPRGLDTTT